MLFNAHVSCQLSKSIVMSIFKVNNLQGINFYNLLYIIPNFGVAIMKIKQIKVLKLIKYSHHEFYHVGMVIKVKYFGTSEMKGFFYDRS